MMASVVSRRCGASLLVRVAAGVLLMVVGHAAQALNCTRVSGPSSYQPAGARGFIVIDQGRPRDAVLDVSAVQAVRLRCQNDRGVLSEELVLGVNPDAAQMGNIQALQMGVQAYSGSNSLDGIAWGAQQLRTGINVMFASTGTAERATVDLNLRVFTRFTSIVAPQTGVNDNANYPLLNMPAGGTTTRPLMSMVVRSIAPTCSASLEVVPNIIDFGRLTRSELVTGTTVRTVNFALRLRSGCPRNAGTTRPYAFFSTSSVVHTMGTGQAIQMNAVDGGGDTGLVARLKLGETVIGWNQAEPQRQITDAEMETDVPLDVPMSAELVVRDSSQVRAGGFRGTAVVTWMYR